MTNRQIGFAVSFYLLYGNGFQDREAFFSLYFRKNKLVKGAFFQLVVVLETVSNVDRVDVLGYGDDRDQ